MQILKASAVLAVLLLAGMGCLFVLDIIPKDTLAEASSKILAVVGILAAAGLVLGLLLKKPDQ